MKFKKGFIPWNKGKKTGPNPKRSAFLMGKKPWNFGKKLSPLTLEHRLKTSKTLKGRRDRKSTRLNSSHIQKSRMPSSA